ncbi:MAG: SRPBCC family protein [Actinomycetota bacterium]
MTDVTVETRVARPRPQVARLMMDPANDLAWIGALTRVEVLGGGPVGTGTQVLRVARFLGRTMEYVNEIVEYAPPARLAMRSVRAPFPMTVVYELAEDGDGTRVTIRTRGDAGGFYRLAAPLLSAAVRRSVAADLRRLKAAVEAEPAGG